MDGMTLTLGGASSRMDNSVFMGDQISVAVDIVTTAEGIGDPC